MQSVIDAVLNPYTCLKDTLPPDISEKEVQEELDRIFILKTAFIEPCDAPALINISGLPGSGKTTLALEMQKQNPNLLYISFDEIMESLSFYQKEAAVDNKAAFARWEIPARFAGYRLLKQAVNKKLSVLFEHSNATIHHIELYKEIIKTGYNVEIRFIEATPELVIPRLQTRPRFFSIEETFERWEVLQNLLPEYQKTATKFTFLGAWKK